MNTRITFESVFRIVDGLPQVTPVAVLFLAAARAFPEIPPIEVFAVVSHCRFQLWSGHPRFFGESLPDRFPESTPSSAGVQRLAQDLRDVMEALGFQATDGAIHRVMLDAIRPIEEWLGEERDRGIAQRIDTRHPIRREIDHHVTRVFGASDTFEPEDALGFFELVRTSNSNHVQPDRCARETLDRIKGAIVQAPSFQSRCQEVTRAVRRILREKDANVESEVVSIATEFLLSRPLDRCFATLRDDSSWRAGPAIRESEIREAVLYAHGFIKSRDNGKRKWVAPTANAASLEMDLGDFGDRRDDVTAAQGRIDDLELLQQAIESLDAEFEHDPPVRAALWALRSGESAEVAADRFGVPSRKVRALLDRRRTDDSKVHWMIRGRIDDLRRRKSAM